MTHPVLLCLIREKTGFRARQDIRSICPKSLDPLYTVSNGSRLLGQTIIEPLSSRVGLRRPHLSEYPVLRLVADADRLRLDVSGSPDFRILRSKRILVGTVSCTECPLSLDQRHMMDLFLNPTITNFIYQIPPNLKQLHIFHLVYFFF